MSAAKTWYFITTSDTTSPAFSDSFNAPYLFTQDGQVSPDGKWKMKYSSGGKTESCERGLDYISCNSHCVDPVLLYSCYVYPEIPEFST